MAIYTSIYPRWALVRDWPNGKSVLINSSAYTRRALIEQAAENYRSTWTKLRKLGFRAVKCRVIPEDME